MAAPPKTPGPKPHFGKLPPDSWPEGLNIGFSTLSAKEVKRARVPAEVLRVCARHNLRKNNSDHRHRSPIDPSKTHLNTVLAGPECPEMVAEGAAAIMARFGLSLPHRIDAVVAFEVVIQPPNGWDTPAFWREAMEWVCGRFEHVVSAVVHRDQKRPHAHILALPVMGGRLAGREMQRGDFGAPKLAKSFRAHMRRMFGLRSDRPTDALARLALTCGRGPKTHAEAARRDAALERQARFSNVGMDIAGHGHSLGSLRKLGATSMPTMSRIAQPSTVRQGPANDPEFRWMMSL